MEATGRAKSSIYTHIREIPLSADRVQQSRRAAGKRIRRFAIARKGKSEHHVRVFDAWSADLVLLVAHLIFDGEITRTRCAYNNRSDTLIARVAGLMRIVYDFEPKQYKNKTTGVRRISYNNVVLGAYMSNKSKELLRDIKTQPQNLKREFVRAFFDDEGCVDYRPNENRRSVRGYQKDVRILKILKTVLRDFDITARIVLPNEIIIVGKDNLVRFEQTINFSSGVCINGNRLNSRWKKHLEKRQILRMAIESFKS